MLRLCRRRPMRVCPNQAIQTETTSKCSKLLLSIPNNTVARSKTPSMMHPISSKVILEFGSVQQHQALAAMQVSSIGDI